jgi:nitrogen-specific signal transduction histidine kinase
MKTRHALSRPREDNVRAERTPVMGSAGRLDDLTTAVLQSFPGYVVMLDTTGRIVAANTAWTTLHAERGPNCVASADVGEDYLASLREVATHASAEQPGIVDIIEAARDGSPRFEAGVTTCRSPDGRLMAVRARRVAGVGSGVVVTFVDVSEWADSARVLQQVARQLVASIAHDLRQPLGALAINVEVAAHLLQIVPPNVSGAVASLTDAATAANQLRESVQVLEDLVARREPSRSSVKLERILNEVARLVDSEASARGVQLEILTPRSLPALSGDVLLLREAVLSLVLDAVENADTSEAGASVMLSARALPNDHIELIVHHKPNQHQLPSQGDGEARRVARAVVEAHGASMAVDLNAVSGTTVRTIWPTQRETVAAQM